MTEKELILETDVLATQYFDMYKSDNGKYIKKVFEEYFNLVKDSDKVSKRVISNAMIILAVYYREIQLIDKEAFETMQETAQYLQFVLESWSLSITGEFLSGELPYSIDIDEIRELIKKKYPNA